MLANLVFSVAVISASAMQGEPHYQPVADSVDVWSKRPSSVGALTGDATFSVPHMQHVRTLLKTMKEHSSHFDRALELGSGGGRLTAGAFLPYFREIVGVEPVDHYRRRLHSLMLAVNNTEWSWSTLESAVGKSLPTYPSSMHITEQRRRSLALDSHLPVSKYAAHFIAPAACTNPTACSADPAPHRGRPAPSHNVHVAVVEGTVGDWTDRKLDIPSLGLRRGPLDYEGEAGLYTADKQTATTPAEYGPQSTRTAAATRGPTAPALYSTPHAAEVAAATGSFAGAVSDSSNAVDQYDAVLSIWMMCYQTDQDIDAFLCRAADAVRERNGTILVQDNIITNKEWKRYKRQPHDPTWPGGEFSRLLHSQPQWVRKASHFKHIMSRNPCVNVVGFYTMGHSDLVPLMSAVMKAAPLHAAGGRNVKDANEPTKNSGKDSNDAKGAKDGKDAAGATKDAGAKTKGATATTGGKGQARDGDAARRSPEREEL